MKYSVSKKVLINTNKVVLSPTSLVETFVLQVVMDSSSSVLMLVAHGPRNDFPSVWQMCCLNGEQKTRQCALATYIRKKKCIKNSVAKQHCTSYNKGITQGDLSQEQSLCNPKTWNDVLTRLSNLLTFQQHALGKCMCTKGTEPD